jgi:hypothetical protein
MIDAAGPEARDTGMPKPALDETGLLRHTDTTEER